MSPRARNSSWCSRSAHLRRRRCICVSARATAPWRTSTPIRWCTSSRRRISCSCGSIPGGSRSSGACRTRATFPKARRKRKRHPSNAMATTPMSARPWRSVRWGGSPTRCFPTCCATTVPHWRTWSSTSCCTTPATSAGTPTSTSRSPTSSATAAPCSSSPAVMTPRRSSKRRRIGAMPWCSPISWCASPAAYVRRTRTARHSTTGSGSSARRRKSSVRCRCRLLRTRSSRRARSTTR